MPAAAAALPGSTSRTSRPSSGGEADGRAHPTARPRPARSRRPGVVARRSRPARETLDASRGASHRPAAPGRSRSRAGSCSGRRAGRSASTSALPDEPAASGAVCSIEPAMRRPRGPRKACPTADTSPNVTRGPWRVAATAKTGCPIDAPASAKRRRRDVAGGDPDERQVRSPRRPPTTSPSASRPSAKTTGTGPPPLTLCAFVSTWSWTDDDPAAAAPSGLDPDDRGSHARRHRARGARQFVEHAVPPSFPARPQRRLIVTCILQSTIDRAPNASRRLRWTR